VRRGEINITTCCCEVGDGGWNSLKWTGILGISDKLCEGGRERGIPSIKVLESDAGD
jgi:hypothetical protein